MGYDLLLTFITLTFLEIILGIDNVIFIALVAAQLPQRLRKSARIFGLALAFIIRILMLMTLSWVMTLTKPLVTINSFELSFKDLLMIFGGLFLIIKSSLEIYKDFKKLSEEEKPKRIYSKDSFFGAAMQIALIDFVFSFDSVITAIAMTDNILLIIIAVSIGMLAMLFASGVIVEFLNKYPSLKVIALAFIFMVGLMLLADGFHLHIEKGYLYFSLFFTMIVESINIVMRNRNN